MCIINSDVHQFIVNYLIPLDPSDSNYNIILGWGVRQARGSDGAHGVPSLVQGSGTQQEGQTWPYTVRNYAQPSI